MYSSNFTSTSAKVALPSVKVSLTIPNTDNNNSSASTNGRRSHFGPNEHGHAAVANSLEALQKSLDRQKQQQQDNNTNNLGFRQQQQTPTSGLFASGGSTVNNRPNSSSFSKKNIRSGAAVRNLDADRSVANDSQKNNKNNFDAADPLDIDDNENNNSMSTPNGNKVQRPQFVNFQLSAGVERALSSNNNNVGYSAFQAALETALRKLERKNSSSSCSNNTAVEIPMEERWSLLADCLTSLDLKPDLHRVCRDIEVIIEEIQKANAYEAAQQMSHFNNVQNMMMQNNNNNNNNANNINNNNNGTAQQQDPNNASYSLGSTMAGAAASSMSVVSPTSAQARRVRQAKARLNGTQTAMAAMMLEQCLNAVSDAAPYAKPAISWLLDTILGSIYVSYDIVRSDLSRSFEKLRLAGVSSASTGTPNAESLIARFYSKTFFQSVRSLSATARENAEHAEEIERSKTRQSRVLERAIAYWARYAMRRVLGAWRGFTKNEKIERDLRTQVDSLAREKQLLKELSEQREKDLNAIGGAANVALLGNSAESLQLQVRELQRALDFERRRATRAEAALALRVVAEGTEDNDEAAERAHPNHQEGGERSSNTTEVQSLRAEVAHYRAVSVEACRLGDIDLHELERAITAQTNVLARGMY